MNNKNRRLAFNAAALAVAMLCLAYASVPLYQLFCAVTGFGGTTRQDAKAPGAKPDSQEITIRFNADIDKNLAWRFAPETREMRVKLGEQSIAHYVAENLTDKSITGRAVYNVVPHKAGEYFVKIHCFCFEKQKLAARQKVDMPVSFYIDPAILRDPETKNIKTITLSYTFFKQ